MLRDMMGYISLNENASGLKQCWLLCHAMCFLWLSPGSIHCSHSQTLAVETPPWHLLLWSLRWKKRELVKSCTVQWFLKAQLRRDTIHNDIQKRLLLPCFIMITAPNIWHIICLIYLLAFFFLLFSLSLSLPLLALPLLLSLSSVSLSSCLSLSLSLSL